MNLTFLSNSARTPVARIAQAASLLRLRPFDVSTEQGRAQERLRRAALTSVAALAAKGVSIITTLVSVPLTIKYLGTERYGLWMTISSVIAMLTFADLGMGNGLLNAISEADGKNDRNLARRYVSSAFFMLLGLSVLLGLVFATLYPFIAWQRVFNVSTPQAIAEAGPSMVVFTACFLISMPLGVVNRVQLGYQEGFANSIWTAVGNLVGLAGVLLAIHFKGGLPWLVLAMAGGPVAEVLLNGVVLFGFRRPWLLPAWHLATRAVMHFILSSGILFFVLQMAVAAMYSVDNLIIAHVLGPDAVSQLSVPARLFYIVPLLLGMLLSPLWPAYRESITRGDISWVRRTLRQSLRISLAFSVTCAAPLVLLGRPILGLWVGPSVTASLWLLAGLGAWTVLSALGSAVGMFLNGANIIRFQVVTAVMLTVVGVALKVLLAFGFGVAGVVWGSVISYILCSGIPMLVYVPRCVRRLAPVEHANAYMTSEEPIVNVPKDL